MKAKEELGFCFSHMGINCNSNDEAKNISDFLSLIFGMPQSENDQAFWSGKEFEVLKNTGAGEKGHICIGTTDFSGAVEYLEALNIPLNYNNVRYDESGKMKVIYLKEQYGGFAIHLMQL